jgi:hypothetical protein
MKAIKAMPRSSILPNRTAPQGVMLQDVTYKVGGAHQAGATCRFQVCSCFIKAR